MYVFKDHPPTQTYTLSLHDALPISASGPISLVTFFSNESPRRRQDLTQRSSLRSEEHTSELQSRQYLVCRLLLEKKMYEAWFPQSCRYSGRYFTSISTFAVAIDSISTSSRSCVSASIQCMSSKITLPPRPTLFPYTTLFRSRPPALFPS